MLNFSRSGHQPIINGLNVYYLVCNATLHVRA